jgi:hypothetical protein
MEELTQILDDLGPLLGKRYRADAGALSPENHVNIRRVA